MAENAPFLPALSPVPGKPVHLAFDGGRLTSDAGVLMLAEIERKLRVAERLAGCIADPRAPERVRHSLVERIRYRALLIASGYEDANDCDALRDDSAFKMAVGRLPETGAELCSQPTMCRLENLPTKTTLIRMMDAMVDFFCDSFAEVPRRRRRPTSSASSSTPPPTGSCTPSRASHPRPRSGATPSSTRSASLSRHRRPCHRTGHPLEVSLPSSYPYKQSLARFAARALPP